MGKPTITYNRTRKQYEVRHRDQYATFPAGIEGQQAAGQQAIAWQNPKVYQAAYYLAFDLFRGQQELFARIWRGAQIAARHGIHQPHPLDDAKTVAQVESQTKPDTFYNVRKFGSIYECACFDCTHRAAPVVEKQPLCKHVLAIKIGKLANQPPAPFPEHIHTGSREDCAPRLVVGVLLNGWKPYQQPMVRPPSACEVSQDDDGTFWRWIWNHNGQRLTASNVTHLITGEGEASPEEVAAAQKFSQWANRQDEEKAAAELLQNMRRGTYGKGKGGTRIMEQRQKGQQTAVTDISPEEIDEWLSYG